MRWNRVLSLPLFAFSTKSTSAFIPRHISLHNTATKIHSSSSSPSTENNVDKRIPQDDNNYYSHHSTLTLLEHININVPEHTHVLPFYTKLLGLGLDPRRAHNVAKGSGTLWANCGASQFHLPYGEVAQRIPGSIGLRYQSLDGLKDRLKDTTLENCFNRYETGTDLRSGREYVKIWDNYGNVFYAREEMTTGPTAPHLSSSLTSSLTQPLVSPTDIDEFGPDVSSTFGRHTTDCKKIEYVEFYVPRGTATTIATFYENALDATTSVVNDGDDVIAVVGCGRIDHEMGGRAEQSLLFRECDEEIPAYDGHHVALYVGNCREDFERAFQHLDLVDAVWVNPRFSDKADSLEGARRWKQFRFKDILDLETGERVFELEHEIRSVEHDAWPGKK